MIRYRIIKNSFMYFYQDPKLGVWGFFQRKDGIAYDDDQFEEKYFYFNRTTTLDRLCIINYMNYNNNIFLEDTI